MILYHGTDHVSAENILQNGIDLKCGDKSVDNGPGFYMTPSREFAQRRANSIAERKNRFSKADSYHPALVEIEFQLPQDDTLCAIKFNSADTSWREFVVINRLGWRFLKGRNLTDCLHNLDNRFDVVIDPTADADVARLVSMLRYNSNIRDIFDLNGYISQNNVSTKSTWGEQVSIHTPKAIQLCIGKMRIISVDAE